MISRNGRADGLARELGNLLSHAPCVRRSQAKTASFTPTLLRLFVSFAPRGKNTPSQGSVKSPSTSTLSLQAHNARGKSKVLSASRSSHSIIWLLKAPIRTPSFRLLLKEGSYSNNSKNSRRTYDGAREPQVFDVTGGFSK
ncbi:hypothetical protein PM082_006201 [Marasmius tenuissimus]|nr:hypothetical protein PM082_006201 [Marasmius tenuissimus]